MGKVKKQIGIQGGRLGESETQDGKAVCVVCVVWYEVGGCCVLVCGVVLVLCWCCGGVVLVLCWCCGVVCGFVCSVCWWCVSSVLCWLCGFFRWCFYCVFVFAEFYGVLLCFILFYCVLLCFIVFCAFCAVWRGLWCVVCGVVVVTLLGRRVSVSENGNMQINSRKDQKRKADPTAAGWTRLEAHSASVNTRAWTQDEADLVKSVKAIETAEQHDLNLALFNVARQHNDKEAQRKVGLADWLVRHVARAT